MFPATLWPWYLVTVDCHPSYIYKLACFCIQKCHHDFPAKTRAILHNKDFYTTKLDGKHDMEPPQSISARDYIGRHLFRALNREVERHRRQRDERIWRTAEAQENAQDADAEPKLHCVGEEGMAYDLVTWVLGQLGG